jgi:hypothetical protein
MDEPWHVCKLVTECYVKTNKISRPTHLNKHSISTSTMEQQQQQQNYNTPVKTCTGTILFPPTINKKEFRIQYAEDGCKVPTNTPTFTAVTLFPDVRRNLEIDFMIFDMDELEL